LLRPELYHPLSQLDVPSAFRTSPKQPTNDTPLEELLRTGHFRSAAILAATKLTSSSLPPSDHVTIFTLFYARLASLTLCGATALASQEVKALEDLSSHYYRDENTGAHLVPWELRVLAIRLQGIGYNDPRKWISGYYDLAREIRLVISKMKGKQENEVQRRLWEGRLEDLGMRVACALVEMGDVNGAVRHLSTLQRGDGSLDLMKGLLWLQIGDVAAARKSVASSANTDTGSVVEALSCMADGNFEEAVDIWEGLCERDSGNEMYAQNLAVSLLYTGHMDEARKVLESLVESGKSFQGLTFNLSTIYELCTDKSKLLKSQLAEKVAALPENGDGWEKVNADFKL
jgi:Flp pilus assembly protein TadD